MSDIADFYSISNSMDIRELQHQQQAQMQLAAFRERGETLARETGVEPVGFFGFDQSHPTPSQASPWAKWLLGAAGGIIAVTAFAAAWPVVAAVAVGGFLLGSLMHEPESTRLGRAFEKYNGYLTQTEIAAYQQTRAPSVADEGPALRTDHAKKLLTEREAVQAQGEELSI